MWCFNVKNLNFLNHIDNLLSFIKKYSVLSRKLYLRNASEIEKQEMLENKDLAWSILEDGYRDQGGYSGATSPEHLVDKSFIWRIIYLAETKIPLVVNVYKKSFGLKRIGSAVTKDPSPYKLKSYLNKSEKFNKMKRVLEEKGEYYSDLNSIAKDALKKIYANDLKTSWVEISGPAESFLLQNVPEAKNYKIPIEKLIKVFRDEIMLEKDDNDGYTYTRIIGGHKHKKRAYGTLKI